MQKELTTEQIAINEAVAPLKNALLLCNNVESVIIDERQEKFLTVEHNNGTVYTVYPRFISYKIFNGYSLSQPIEPNHTTGSSVSLVGNDEYYNEGFTLSKVMDTIRKGEKHVPYFFTKKMRETTKHQTWHTVRLSPFHRDDIQLKGEKPIDREMVNSCIKQDKSYRNSYMQKVSEEFVEEMRDCVPPAFMGKSGPFYFIQVGEATDHKAVNGEYVEVYETYVRATESNEMTEQYAVGQWYFMGIKPLIKN
jgi:hypothetical protein